MEGRRQLADHHLQAALHALAAVRKADLIELKCVRNPQKEIEEVFKAIMILFNESEDHSWPNFIRMHGDLDTFIEKAQRFHERSPRLDNRIRDELTPIIRTRLNYEALNRCSTGAANLYNWISNLLSYYEVIEQATED